jgi:hypothetical protein
MYYLNILILTIRVGAEDKGRAKKIMLSISADYKEAELSIILAIPE